MKKQIPAQLIVGLGILLVGGGIVGGEFLFVKWYPGHKEAVTERTLQLEPFKNDGVGVEMMVAAGINGRVEPFAGGVRIFSPRIFGKEPTITITSQPNPDQRSDFTPQETAIWESDGAQHSIPRYTFEETRINQRDAVLIWQYKDREMVLTTRIISPERIIEATCTPGSADESLYMQACDDSVRTMKVAGPPSVQPPAPSYGEGIPATPPHKH
jgi:hypothetical protein